MNFLLIALLLAVGISGGRCLPEEIQKQLKAIHRDCAASSGVAEELIYDAMEGRFANDDKLKEFGLCFGKQLGFLNQEGIPNIEGIRGIITQYFGESIANQVTATCNKTAATPGDTALEMFKCIFELVPM